MITQKALTKMPFWKSGNYLRNLEGNVAGLRALIVDSGFASIADLEDELKFEFCVAEAHLEKLAKLNTLAPADVAANTEVEGLLLALATVLRSIQTTVADRLAGSVGVHAGFNSDDGD